MKRSEFRDLNKLAQKRTREAAVLVLQLLDTDEERSAMLLSCALDFIHGAAENIKQVADDEGEDISDRQALAGAVVMLIRILGIDVMETALQTMRKAKQ